MRFTEIRGLMARTRASYSRAPLLGFQPHVRFRDTPSSGSRIVPCGRTDGQTDRHDEANSHVSAILRMHLRINALIRWC